MKAFHRGELQVQHRAGTIGVATELGEGIEEHLAFGIDRWLTEATTIFVSTTHPTTGEVWAHVLCGNQGFISAPNPKLVEIQEIYANTFLPESKFVANLQEDVPISIMVINFAQRQRYRINGVIIKVDLKTRSFALRVKEAFFNCPKYIQRRIPLEAFSDGSSIQAKIIYEGTKLESNHATLISQSDTFFMGSFFEERGTDITHRGGNPGFVQVRNSSTISWPEYRGNGMFQTTGNLAVNPSSGIVFVDFETGTVLQLTGESIIEWKENGERDIAFHVKKVVEIRKGISFPFQFLEYSPYNPIIDDMVVNKDGFPVEVPCVKIVQNTPHIKTFRFLTPFKVPFSPGQYATFRVVANGNEYVRTWTISETPNSVEGDYTIEISVKKKEGGIISSWLHESFQVGNKLILLGIDGSFGPFLDFKKNKLVAEKLLFLSAGVGITPMMAFIRGLGAVNLHPNVLFLHTERNLDEIPFLKEIQRRSSKKSGLEVVFTLTKPPNDWSGISGRISKDVLSQVVPDLHERVVSLCGPESFMRDMTTYLHQLGLPDANLKTERFDF